MRLLHFPTRCIPWLCIFFALISSVATQNGPERFEAVSVLTFGRPTPIPGNRARESESSDCESQNDDVSVQGIHYFTKSSAMTAALPALLAHDARQNIRGGDDVAFTTTLGLSGLRTWLRLFVSGIGRAFNCILNEKNKPESEENASNAARTCWGAEILPFCYFFLAYLSQ